MKTWYEKHRKEKLEYQKNYQLNNRRYKKYQDNYRKSEHGKLIRHNARKKYRDSKNGHILHYQIDMLKRYGYLIMENCAICNNPKTECHHPNNKLPLHVYWLCKKHHVEQHYKKIEILSILKEREKNA